jgi:hypothetical protein
MQKRKHSCADSSFTRNNEQACCNTSYCSKNYCNCFVNGVIGKIISEPVSSGSSVTATSQVLVSAMLV